MSGRTAAQRLARQAEAAGLGLLTSGPVREHAALARRPVRDVGRLVVLGVLLARFDTRAARGIDATFELRLLHRDGRGHDPLAIRVRDGRCRILPRAAATPDVVITTRLDHLLLVVSGEVVVGAALGDGRMRVEGDVFLFTRFPGLFGGLG